MVDRSQIIAMRQDGSGLSRDGVYWNEEERIQLLESFHQGLGISEIAVLLQRSERAIMQQLTLFRCFQNETRSRERHKKLQPKYTCLCHICTKQKQCKHSPQNRKETHYAGELSRFACD